MKKLVQIVGRARHQGISQYELAIEVGVKPKDIFHHLMSFVMDNIM